MAFEIKIKSSGLKKQKINVDEIISKLGFEFGSYNDAYVLQHDEIHDNTYIVYNPNCKGRGIFLDTNKLEENNEILIAYNIPTTKTEINDFFRLSKEIIDDFGSVELYNEQEIFTVDDFFDEKDSMIEFSLKTLNQNASFEFNENNWAITTAMFPYTFSDDERNIFSKATDFIEFEKRLHEVQSQDVYYAKPNLFYNQSEDVNIAIYTLTEECTSVFPLNGKNSLVKIKFDTNIDVSWIRFYIYSQDRLLEGYFDYEKFIEKIKEITNDYFDKDHIIIPTLNKDEIIEIADYLKENGHAVM